MNNANKGIPRKQNRLLVGGQRNSLQKLGKKIAPGEKGGARGKKYEEEKQKKKKSEIHIGSEQKNENHHASGKGEKNRARESEKRARKICPSRPPSQGRKLKSGGGAKPGDG